MIGQTLDKWIRVMLYIFIFWIPYSSAVVETSVIVGFVLWMIKRILLIDHQAVIASKKNLILGFLPKRSPLNGGVALFIGICILSSIGSLYPKASLLNFITKTLEWFVVYFLVIETFTDRKHVIFALKIFLFSGFATILDSLYQNYISYQDIFLGRTILPGFSPTAAFNTSNSLGGFLTIYIPVAVAAYYLTRNKTWKKWIMIGLIAMAMWSLYVTNSRGAWLGVILGIGLCLFLFTKKIQFRLCVELFIVFLLCGILFIDSYTGLLSHSSEGKTLNALWRIEMWKDVLQMIRERPIFGHGINTFMNLFQVYNVQARTAPTYAHNCYLQIAAETGIAGLGIFMYIIFQLFNKSIERVNKSLENLDPIRILSIGALGGILAFLTQCFFDTNLYGLRLSLYFWFMVGMLMSMERIYQKELEANTV